MFEWAYDGVNSSIPRNVGPECANYLTLKRRLIETLFISVFIISCIIWGLKRITLPKKMTYGGQDRVGRRILMIIMSLVLGMEIGFKFTSRTVIYLLNPCHITTALQVSFFQFDLLSCQVLCLKFETIISRFSKSCIKIDSIIYQYIAMDIPDTDTEIFK